MKRLAELIMEEVQGMDEIYSEHPDLRLISSIINALSLHNSERIETVVKVLKTNKKKAINYIIGRGESQILDRAYIMDQLPKKTQEEIGLILQYILEIKLIKKGYELRVKEFEKVAKLTVEDSKRDLYHKLKTSLKAIKEN